MEVILSVVHSIVACTLTLLALTAVSGVGFSYNLKFELKKEDFKIISVHFRETL